MSPSHRSPVKPGRHIHLYWPIPSMQCPPFKQGVPNSVEHSSTSTSQCRPETQIKSKRKKKFYKTDMTHKSTMHINTIMIHHHPFQHDALSLRFWPVKSNAYTGLRAITTIILMSCFKMYTHSLHDQWHCETHLCVRYLWFQVGRSSRSGSPGWYRCLRYDTGLTGTRSHRTHSSLPDTRVYTEKREKKKKETDKTDKKEE